MDGSIGRTALDGIISVVSKSAPLMGAVLGSPLASVGISLLANILGVDPRDTQAIMDKINATPDIDVKLKELEYQNRQTLLQIAAQNYVTEVDDRKNARLREMTLKDWVPTILAIGFLINYAVMQFYCVTHTTSANDIISARFQDVLIMIISYYFGSSHKQPNQVS
jgi:hypothetical protein